MKINCLKYFHYLVIYIIYFVTLLDPPSREENIPLRRGTEGDEFTATQFFSQAPYYWIDEMHNMKSIEMDNPNTFKQLGSGLFR
jgi:hypothetical protein